MKTLRICSIGFWVVALQLALGQTLPAGTLVQSADLDPGAGFVYQFTSSDNTTATNLTAWTAPTGVTTIQLLVLGGGGGGAGHHGGGGGAGGLQYNATYAVVPSSSYAIQIGGGGDGGIHFSTAPANGGNSFFDIFTSLGGGAGGGAPGSPQNGGSGGGQGGDNHSSAIPPGSGSIGEGNDGGFGHSGGGFWAGGGGGGASGVGGNAGVNFGDNAGAGGPGVLLSSYFGSLAFLADAVAGGGGGGTADGTPGTATFGGGAGGGAGFAATFDTGAGGGGGGNVSPGANGAAGTVILAFTIAEAVPEPSTFVSAGLGILGLGCVALRKKYRHISCSAEA